MHMLVDTPGDGSRGLKVYRTGRMWTVGASIFVFQPHPHLQTLQSLRQQPHDVIYCGKSPSHIIGLKLVKDAKQFQLDPTIHESKALILFVLRNHQSRLSVYLSHILIVGCM